MKPGVALVAAAAGSVLLLGSCAAPDQSATTAAAVSAVAQDTTADVLSNAVATARAAGSARITGSIATTTPQRSGTATISGVQAFDPATMDLTVSSDAFGAGMTVRQVLVDGKAYVQVPELGGKWAAIDLAQFAGMVNPMLAGIDLGGLPKLQPTGTGTVEGVAVSYYQADIDLNEALRIAGLPTDAMAKLDGKLADDAGSATVKIAIDDKGRLVQWTLESRVNLSDGGTMTSTADVRWYDFGVATDVSAPAADQVIDAGSLAGMLPTG